MSSKLYIGLMSGTSMDAVDCALVDLSEPMNVIDFINIDIPEKLKQDTLELCQEDGNNQIKILGQTDVALGKLFASTAISIIEKISLVHRRFKPLALMVRPFGINHLGYMIMLLQFKSPTLIPLLH